MNSVEATFIAYVQTFCNHGLTWDEMHQIAIDMEVNGEVEALTDESIIDLHDCFLSADSHDDPQFLTSNDKICAVLRKVSMLDRS